MPGFQLFTSFGMNQETHRQLPALRVGGGETARGRTDHKHPMTHRMICTADESAVLVSKPEPNINLINLMSAAAHNIPSCYPGSGQYHFARMGEGDI